MAHDIFGAALTDVLDAGSAALTVPATRALYAPGAQVAWDECCDGGGQLWVRLVSVIPRMASTTVIGWVVTAGMGVLRCAASVDSRGNMPSAEALTHDTNQMTQDASDLSKAILEQIKPHKVNGWQPLGPEGGCVGGEWTFSFFVTCAP